MMVDGWQPVLQLLGRTLLALHFFIGGLDHLKDWSGTVRLMAVNGIPFPSACLALALPVLIGGSVFLALGYQTELAAVALIAFAIPATLLFHDYWNYRGRGVEFLLHYIVFFSNTALIGALLVLIAVGGGTLSLDSWISAK